MLGERVVFHFLPGAGAIKCAGLFGLGVYIFQIIDGVIAGMTPADVEFAVKLILAATTALGYVWFTKRIIPSREAIICDADGIGGLAIFENAVDRIAWPDIQSLAYDQRAVVLRFKPIDLRSPNPRDRRSEIRLASPKHSPQEIEGAIRRFCAPPTRA